MHQQIKVQQITNYQQSTGLEPANYQKAIEQKRQQSNRYYKGEQVPWLAQLSHFKIYGVGIYLFFSFLKHAAIFFAILTIMSIVPIAFNVARGSTLKNSANGLNVYLTKTSLGSYKYSLMTVQNAYELSISYKVLNVSFDIITCAIFLIFCLYWEYKSRKIAQHIAQEIKLQSNLTIQATQFSQDTKQNQMEEFMNKFGNVTEVVAARDYTKEITISKNIYQLQLQAKQLQFEDESKNQSKINELNQQIRSLHSQLDEVSTRSHQITNFYIQFATPEQRNNVLSKFQEYQRVCNCCTQIPQNMLLQNQKVVIAPCNTQPLGILWQNAHFTWKMRIPRLILQLFIVLAFIVGGFIFVSFLNILVPPIETNVDTTNIDYNHILIESNKTIIQAWCVQNYAIQGASSPYFQTCSSIWKLYFNSVVITISISIIILILCEIIKRIVYALANFQRYTTKTEQSVTIMTNLFIMNFLTTTLITFLMQANIFSLSVMAFMANITTSADLHNNINSITQYNDLTSGWYKDVGYQIWFNIFMQIFLPQALQPLGLYLQECLQSWKAKKQKIHQKMVKTLESPQFQIQDFYANILLIIATGIIFGGGIQLMMVVVFLCMVIRYFYLRYLFTRFCKIPLNYSQILNERLVLILKVILFIRFLISLYMYGAEDVFAMQKSTFMKWASSLSVPVFSSIFIVFSRILLTWYYSIFIVLFILVLIFKQLIFKGIKRIKKWKKAVIIPTKQNTTSQIIQNQTIIKSKSIQSHIQDSIESWASNENDTIKSQRKVLKSYRLQNNPLYSQILIIMKLKGKKQQKKAFPDVILQKNKGGQNHTNSYKKSIV